MAIIGSALAGQSAAEGLSGEVQINVGHLSDDAFRYGRHSGLTDSGLVMGLNMFLDSDPERESRRYWLLDVERLGSETFRALEVGRRGDYRVRLNYQELPFYITQGQTPFIGNNPLTLPTGWQVEGDNTAGLTELEANLQPIDFHQTRERLRLDYRHRLGANWTATGEFRREAQTGNRVLGGVTGYSGGNNRAALLPAPVNYETLIAELGLSYNGGHYQWGLAYYGSLFHNSDDSLVWTTPFGAHPQWADGTGYPEGRNQLALEPDNQHHQLRLFGGISLFEATRAQLDVALGRLRQNQAFLPYTVNENLTVTEPLPQSSLQGRVDTTHANLRITSRPAPQWHIATRVRYRDRDNRTPQAEYQRVRGDAEHQQAPESARINRPYSLTVTQLGTDAAYRLNRRVRLSTGYEYQYTERDYSEVRRMEEHAIKAGARTSGSQYTAFSAELQHQQRRGSEYLDQLPYRATHVPGTIGEEDFENHPLLRKYYLADRDRDQLRLRADVFPHAQISLGATFVYNQDDYQDVVFGLDESVMTSWVLDLAYNPREDLRLSSFVSADRYASEQFGRSFRGSVPADASDPERDWQVSATDRFNTSGFNLEWENLQEQLNRDWLSGQLNLKLDLVYSRSRGDIDPQAGPALVAEPLPSLSTRLLTYRINLDYALSERAVLHLGVEREHYRSADFSLDNVAPDTVANVLTLGETSPSYQVTWVMLGYRYRF